MIQMTNSTMTPATFAETVDSDGRTVRKFLRSITPKDEQPGKGSRWVLPHTKRELTKLQKQFAEWETAAAEKAAAKETEQHEAGDEVDETELDD